jgi:hypothetical protein
MTEDANWSRREFGQVCRAAAAAAISLIVSVPSMAIADERAFQEHCAICHHRASSVVRRLIGETAEERTAGLDRFLETHHAEDPKLRAAIVGYLTRLSPQ